MGSSSPYYLQRICLLSHAFVWCVCVCGRQERIAAAEAWAKNRLEFSFMYYNISWVNEMPTWNSFVRLPHRICPGHRCSDKFFVCATNPDGTRASRLIHLRSVCVCLVYLANGMRNALAKILERLLLTGPHTHTKCNREETHAERRIQRLRQQPGELQNDIDSMKKKKLLRLLISQEETHTILIMFLADAR